MKAEKKPQLLIAMSFQIRIDLYDFSSEWKTETTVKDLHPGEQFPREYYLRIAEALEARAQLIRGVAAAKQLPVGKGAVS